MDGEEGNRSTGERWMDGEPVRGKRVVGVGKTCMKRGSMRSEGGNKLKGEEIAESVR